jgi:citrate synthase
MARTKSSVDWVDLETETLYVRDRKLLSMIKEFDFIDAIFHTWLHKKASLTEKKMLNSLMVAFCGGWSITVPVILSARLAATTRAPMAQCLAAGFCAGGPSHTSAIQKSMEVYVSTPLDHIDGYVENALGKGERIPGFGHPILDRDPRPKVLRKLFAESGIKGDAVRKFDRIEAILSKRKGIYGNIDGIGGAILLDLGFKDPSFGPAFFLIGRSLSMTAHIIEEYKNKPFSVLEIIHPGFKKMDYEYADRLEAD